MKFTPCQDACTKDGTHCEGCGRSLQEIAETKAVVASAIELIRRYQYDNPEDFVATLGKSILKKRNRP
jgi:Protein of unknown function (DUF1289)